MASSSRKLYETRNYYDFLGPQVVVGQEEQLEIGIEEFGAPRVRETGFNRQDPCGTYPPRKNR